MLGTVTTKIDSDLCIGCGLCVQVCPSATLSLVNEKATVTGDRSLNCGHCQAVCPEGAIVVKGIDETMSQFVNFVPDSKWLRYGDFDTTQLVRLMASRRSCRNFTDRPVERSLLEDLVRIGCTAPSGTNCQGWTFTILTDREAVMVLGKEVRNFYLRLNSLARIWVLRKSLTLMGKRELEAYYKGYYQVVKEGLEEFDRSGVDKLFHGAPAAIVVGCKTDATLPIEDALLATQNILLGAHSLGLGTCLIGMAVEAIKRYSKIKKVLGVPNDERVYSIIALGYSAETYQRIAGRKKALIRLFETS